MHMKSSDLIKKANIGLLITNGIFAFGIFVFYYVFFIKLVYKDFSMSWFILGLSPIIQYSNSIKKINCNIRDDNQMMSLALNVLFSLALVIILIEQIVEQKIIRDISSQNDFHTGFFLALWALALPMFQNILITIVFFLITLITKRVRSKYIFEIIISSIMLLIACFNKNLTTIVVSYIIIDIVNLIFLFVPE